MQLQTRMRITAVVIGSVLINSIPLRGQQEADESVARVVNEPQLTVRVTKDFELTGDGSADAWAEAKWIDLNRRPNAGHDYSTRFKTLYSETGIYFLFDGTDSLLTATMEDDFDDLYLEDVFEVFLWTDESHSVYFEYEISPLDKELPILIPNFGGHFMGWRPWRYEGDRKTRTKVSIKGGSAQSGSRIMGWTAEVFIPYLLLNPLKNVPPKSGMKWRANVYRIDYDNKKMTQWDWARVGPSFHDYKGFGTFVFE
jgi:hypothetical protein